MCVKTKQKTTVTTGEIINIIALLCCWWRKNHDKLFPKQAHGLTYRQWEKEKLLFTSNFSYPYGVFYPLGELSTIFIQLKIVVYKLFQFGRV